MEELITLRQMETILLGLLALGVLAGIAALFVARRRGADPVLPAVALSAPPVILYVLWRVYNLITDALGLDRVVNLVANAALFVAVGAICGWGWAWLSNRRVSGTDTAGES